MEEWNYLLGKEINTNRRKEKLRKERGFDQIMCELNEVIISNIK